MPSRLMPNRNEWSNDRARMDSSWRAVEWNRMKRADELLARDLTGKTWLNQTFLLMYFDLAVSAFMMT